MRNIEFNDNGQFSLFDLFSEEELLGDEKKEGQPVANEKPKADNTAKKKNPKVKKEKSPIRVVAAKPQLPGVLKEVSKCKSFHDFLALFGFTGIAMDEWRDQRMYYAVNERDIFTGSRHEKYLDFGRNFQRNKENRLVYIGHDGTCWQADLKFDFETSPTLDSCRDRYGNYSYKEKTAILKGLTVSAWTVITRLPEVYTLLQLPEELDSILKKVNPYGFEFAKTKGAPSSIVLLIPYIETLSKAGFAFADNILYGTVVPAQVECFNRLCKNGKSPKEIFKTTKPVYNCLKQERNLGIWDAYRKMDKFGRITPDAISRCYEANFSEKDLGFVSEILAKRYHGKQILTWDQLIAYLERLDAHEAIYKAEALPLIRDYLSMCQTLNMQPRIDGDSLKREHDVAARLVRTIRVEKMNENMKEAYEKMSVYNYSEQIYFVRAIKDHDDLIDEATQQHNCLATYAGWISNGKSYIYVCREVKNPEKSLVSIELDPKQLYVRQKYLACNQPIRNKSITEFIDRWVKFVKDTARVNKKGEKAKENSLEINAA